jgi:hypothetical protein
MDPRFRRLGLLILTHLEMHRISSSRRAPHNLLLLDVGRIVVAHSLAGEGKHTCSLLWVLCHPFQFHQVLQPLVLAAQVPPGGSRPLSPAVSISVNRTTPKSRQQKPGTLVVTTDIQSVYVNLNKPLLDGLQYWVDDVSQLAERVLGISRKILVRNVVSAGTLVFSVATTLPSQAEGARRSFLPNQRVKAQAKPL